MQMWCEIYKSSKKEEMYLYVARVNSSDDQEPTDPLGVLSDAMKSAFGRATFVMSLELYEGKKLARANVMHVMDSIQNNGYFLQLPPEGLINPNAVEPEGLRGA